MRARVSRRTSYRLLAVAFVDIVGYTRLCSEDEEKAIRLAHLFEEVVASAARRFDGRVVKFIGDGALIVFYSAADAVRMGEALIRLFPARAREISAGDPELRIGIHAGELARPDSDPLGDGVNVASRLCGEAEPNQVLVSGNVRGQLAQRKDFRFEPCGSRRLKNRQEEVEVFAARVDIEEYPEPPPPGAVALLFELHRRHVLMAAGVYALIVLVFWRLSGGDLMNPLPISMATIGAGLGWVLLTMGLVTTAVLAWLYDVSSKGLVTRGWRPDNWPPTSGPLVSRKEAIVYVSLATVILILSVGAFPSRLQAGDRSIAVLSFASEAERESLSMLLASEIRNRLMGAKSLRVTAASSSRYGDQRPSIAGIGRELGVGSVLHGDLQVERGRVRLAARLTNLKDATITWEKSYDGQLDQVASMASKIAHDVAEEMAVDLSGSTTASDEQLLVEDLEAFELVHLGQEFLHGESVPTRESLLAAAGYFEQALELAPDLGEALQGLATAHLALYREGDRSPRHLAAVQRAIDRMRHVGVESWRTDLVEALRLHWVENDFAEARERYRVVRSQMPNHAEALLWAADVERRLGNWDEAVELYRRSADLDPRSVRVGYELARTLYRMRDYRAALDEFDRARRLAPGTAPPAIGLAFVYLADDGSIHQARTVLERARAERRTRSNGRVWTDPFAFPLAYVSLLEGKHTEAIQHVQSMSDPFFEYDGEIHSRDLLRAEILELLDRPSEARAYYEDARRALKERMTASPEDLRARSELAVALAGLGRPESLEEAEEALRRTPPEKDAIRGPERLEDLARVHLKLGSPELSAEAVERLLSIPSRFSRSLVETDPRWGAVSDQLFGEEGGASR